MASLVIDDIPQTIVNVKRQLRRALPNYRGVFLALEENIRSRRTDPPRAGRRPQPVPQIDAEDILQQRVSEQQIALIKQRGACAIRGVFPRAKAEGWNREIGDYLERNNFVERLKNAAEDNYFGKLAASKPQIYGIYWSQPQVEARQDARMHAVQVFLNSLWATESNGKQHFDPTRVATRRSHPPPPAELLVVASRRTSTAAPSSAGWTKTSAMCIATFSPATGSSTIPSPPMPHRGARDSLPGGLLDVPYLPGWTALTPQRTNAGTLNLVPIANAMAYVCCARCRTTSPTTICVMRRRAVDLGKVASPLLSGISLFPIEPGDTVFWHCDVIHAVENEHNGEFDSNVMYTPRRAARKTTPICSASCRALSTAERRRTSPPTTFEVDFDGRATADLLTPLGKAQLGMR